MPLFTDTDTSNLPYAEPMMPAQHNFNAPNDFYEKEVDTDKIALAEAEIITPIRECPKFRILIVGQTGVGKSTILSKVFGITDVQAGVSHSAVGTKTHQVWSGVTFPGQNDRIIIHDSGGFEASDMDNMREVEKFIGFRKGQPRLEDQLHCIWYCISCRSTRPIQKSEQHFFTKVDVGRIPVVVVFTQFDVLVNNKFGEKMMDAMRQYGVNANLLAIKQEAEHAAIAEYDQNYRNRLIECVGLTSRVGVERVGFPPKEDDGEALNRLIANTLSMLQQEGLKTLWVSAQRHSANLKLDRSVKRGIRYFWRSVGASTVPFAPIIGATGLYSAFDRAFACISALWGLPDPEYLLIRKRTRQLFLGAIYNASVSERIGRRFLESINIFGPLTAWYTAATFLKMIASIALIHELLFWREWARYDDPVTETDIKTACDRFAKSNSRKRMIAQIEGQIGISTWMSRDDCSLMCMEAVEIGRSDLYSDFTRKTFCRS